MCRNCKNKKCSGCDPDLSGLIDNIKIINDVIENIGMLTKFLNGHPILVIDDPEDIAMFDLITGIGSKNWLGWGVCNGNTYNSHKGVISTPDMRDRFIAGSYGTYAVGDVGGINTVALITAELPVHSHTLTDPGHIHAITDPGHIHLLTDPGHTHAVVANPHQHSFTTEPADGVGSHTHDYEDHQKNNIYINGITDTAVPVTIIESVTVLPGSVRIGDDNDHSDTRTTSAPGSASTHFHTGTTDQTTESLAASTATTGIAILSHTTGITNQSASTGITIGNAGSGVAHENRPPFYAAIFVKKIY